jgi:hypothetical protein
MDWMALFHGTKHPYRAGDQLVSGGIVAPCVVIQALLLCHFLAMLTEALIEREVRTSMKTNALTGVPLYPELRNCPAPSAARILEIFTGIQRHHLISDDIIGQTFDPSLTPLHKHVLDLLHVPTSVYTTTSDA